MPTDDFKVFEMIGGDHAIIEGGRTPADLRDMPAVLSNGWKRIGIMGFTKQPDGTHLWHCLYKRPSR